MDMKKLTLVIATIMLLILLMLSACAGNNTTDTNIPSLVANDDALDRQETSSEDLLSEYLIASPTEAAMEERIDLQELIESYDNLIFFDSMQYLFGKPTTESVPGYEPQRYHFTNGLSIDSYSEFLNFIVVDYRQTTSRTEFHFAGIDGTSTIDDVQLAFGRASTERVSRGFRTDGEYEMLVDEYGFAEFIFSTDRDLQLIRIFVPAISADIAQDTPVDIRPLLGRQLDEVRGLLGRQTGYFPVGMLPGHVFEGGVYVEGGSVIEHISVGYIGAENPAAFHFNGIDGTSSRNDVLAILVDAQPIIFGENEYGFDLSEGYLFTESYLEIFVRIRFNEEDFVTSISFFYPA